MAQGPQLLPPDPATSRVLEAVAVTSGVDPLELPPLYDVVDPDKLDALVASMSDGEITFTYAGYEVTVDGGNGVEVSEPSSSTE